jgi:uncharacterized protein
MLRIDIRELRKGPVETSGVIPPTGPLLEGLGLDLTEPLRVSGVLEATGRGDFFWRGEIAGRVHENCRRCLRDLEAPLSLSVEAVFSASPELQDDPSVYPLTEPVSHVDVSEAVREELALAASRYPLCQEACAGLCPRCGADLNQGPCGCSAPPAKP